MIRTKKWFLTLCASTLVFCAAAAALAAANPVSPAADAAGQFVITDEIKIAHLTDTHYYPLNYCYPDNEGTDFADTMISGTKLLLESSFMNRQTFAQILAENPDYLLISGDLSLNGEIQAHIEMANLLRELQNTIRNNGNPDFQVFVSVGNHDMYNPDAEHFRNNGKGQPCNHLTTRKDITKIYSSLGYPDLSDQEIEDYYATLTDVYFDNLPYAGNYINSTTAENVTIDWQYRENGLEAQSDYTNGDISYIAYLPKNYTLISIDEEISDAEINHHVGGYFYESTRDYLMAKSAQGLLDGQSVIGMMHHNVVPHFAYEDTLLKEFTIYGWREVADFLADLGMRYVFTGHMHSNDIATHESLNHNVIIDTETASPTGYKGGTRYTILQRGLVDGKYAENYLSTIELVENVDVTKLFEDNYMSDDYIAFCNLGKYLMHDNGSAYITDSSEYAATKLFRNIVNNVKYAYLRPDFIAGLGDLLAKMLGDGVLSLFSNAVSPLINGLIVHLEDVVLADYTYTGQNPAYQGTGRGKKICGYLDELLTEAMEIKVNPQGDTLFDFGVGSYLMHNGGTDSSLADAPQSTLDALAGFYSGETVQALIDLLLDEQKGLLRLVKGLLLPIDLTAAMSEESAQALIVFLRIFDNNIQLDPKAFVLNVVVPPILSTLGGMFGFSFSLEGLSLGDYLDKVLNDYITDSFYTGLGEIAYNILYSFRIDETASTENNFDGVYVNYELDASLPCTYVSDKAPEAPSIQNGKLPSMLSVTFGEDPATTKNFVWFTDRRITGTQIQYRETGRDLGEEKTGEFSSVATTTASIDLGVYATLMHVSVGRHTVSLTGLKPGTEYTYRVGSAQEGYWSEFYTFKTAPAGNEPFELLLLTDIQGSALRTYKQVDRILSEISSVFPNGYDFVINCGDVVDNAKNLAQWKYFLDTSAAYWGNTTQVVAAGNHDQYTYEAPDEVLKTMTMTDRNAAAQPYSYFLSHYNISYPEQNDLTGAYYSFDYSGVHFTVLNTNNLGSNNKLAVAQRDWLIADLQSTQKIKVVIMHKGIYSSGSHSKDADVVALRAQLTSIFAEYGVRLVLAGHDHTYTETYYLDSAGNPVDTSATGKAKLGKEGTLYVTLGTMGDKFYDYTENPNIPVEFGEELHNPHLANPTFGKLVYDGANLYYYGYEYDLETDSISFIRGNEKSLSLWEYIVFSSIAGSVLAAVIASIAIGIKNRKRIEP
jgi:3',5'-cyclic AMP phosphodiesterase CpdA